MTQHNGAKMSDGDKRRQMQNHRQFNQRQNFNLRGTHPAQPIILPATNIVSDESSKLVKPSVTIRKQKKIPVKLPDPFSESATEKASSGFEDFIRMYA